MRDFKSLISQMTIEEKTAQMTQLMSDTLNFGDSRVVMGLNYGFNLAQEMIHNIGSGLTNVDAKSTILLQQNYLAQAKHKIPLLIMEDVIHGYKTIFPSPLAMASAFDPEVARVSAEIAAKEAAVSGVHVTFSPMVDLCRDARWGRVIESNGEDPYLSSLYAAASVKGFQGEHPGGKYKVAACVKHFAGYGAAEAGRDYNTTEIGEYALFDQYLPAYRSAVDAGCRLVMTAFNAINGIPCTGSQYLFRDILRKQWGFTGTVISDCTAVYELVPHGYAADPKDAAKKSIEAGVDIEMVSTAFFDHARELIESGDLDEALLDEAVERILQLKDEMGLFENPYKDADPEEEAKILLCPEHRKAARSIARRSMVLLQNKNNLLPLDPKSDQKIALIGPYASSREIMDIWKCRGEEQDCIPLSDGIGAIYPVSVALGCEIDRADDSMLQEAIDLAAQSDVIVLALGESNQWSSEAGSRAYITLPQCQIDLCDQIASLGKPVIAVLFNGRPLELKGIDQKVDTVLEVWFPGTEGGAAIAELLFGLDAPSARLPMSFPETVGQCPVYYNAYNTGRPKGNDHNPERFVSRYLDAPNAPRYPFGYGLTYTTFTYSLVKLSADKLYKSSGASITAKAVIKNTGERIGTETVQLYLRDVTGSRVRPVKELKGIQKITLNPGDEAEVVFEITEKMLEFYTENNCFEAEKGQFNVWIAADSSAQEFASFSLV